VGTPGHGITYTIVVLGFNSKDRAQILQVGPTQTSPKRSPSQTCELIMKKMTTMVSALPLPLKGSEGIEQLGDAANKFRDNPLKPKA